MLTYFYHVTSCFPLMRCLAIRKPSVLWSLGHWTLTNFLDTRSHSPSNTSPLLSPVTWWSCQRWCHTKSIQSTLHGTRCKTYAKNWLCFCLVPLEKQSVHSAGWLVPGRTSSCKDHAKTDTEAGSWLLPGQLPSNPSEHRRWMLNDDDDDDDSGDVLLSTAWNPVLVSFHLHKFEVQQNRLTEQVSNSNNNNKNKTTLKFRNWFVQLKSFEQLLQPGQWQKQVKNRRWQGKEFLVKNREVDAVEPYCSWLALSYINSHFRREERRSYLQWDLISTCEDS